MYLVIFYKEIAMIEEWKDIPGYEGLYQASSLGRIRSLHRGYIEAHMPKRVLRPGSNRHGRLQVALSRIPKGEIRAAVTTRFQVHRLVLLAFKGECPPGMNGLHDDGNHLNNCIKNLYYGTQKQNMADRARHYEEKHGSPERPSNAKLTDDDVRFIRASPASQKTLAERYGITQAAISHIRTRKTWKATS